MSIKYVFFSLLVVTGLLVGVFTSFPDQNLHLVFCDVGQGDAALISRGSTQILIDGGPNQKVLSCLSENMPFWDKDLEIVLLTHPEADHITGLVSVIERYNVKQIISSALVSETGVFLKFRAQVQEKKIPVLSPKSGDKIKIGMLEIKIIFPLEKLGSEVVWQKADDLNVLGLSAYEGNFNETAIVTELDFGEFEALLTGDIGMEQEKEIEEELEKIEVLKVAHHGSKYSTSESFLEGVRPELAVISAGANNRYGHPSSEVLGRLKSFGIKVLRTDKDGEVEVVSDGKSWGIK